MYTQREFKSDLYEICSSYYIKFKLLEDYIYGRISCDFLVNQLSETKPDEEIDEIIGKLNKILYIFQQNNGNFDKDPIEEAYKLRKDGNIQDAYKAIFPYLQNNKENEDALICFCWIMYDFLKKREDDVDNYCRNLEIFNKNVSIDFNKKTSVRFDSQDNPLETLKNSFLWSILRVVKNDEQNANKIFPVFIKFFTNNMQIVEKRRVAGKELSPSRLIIKEIRGRLTDRNYLEFMGAIGFKWFDNFDYHKSSFKNDNDETIKIKSFAEDVLDFHVKKLISTDENVDNEINDFLHILKTLPLNSLENSDFLEYLPYNRIKLLMKTKQKDKALEELIIFARNKSTEFWTWDLLSKLVSADEEFDCLCAGLLCRTKDEMLVKLQIKVIPFLIEKGLFSNAKFELDKLISIRNKKGWRLPEQLIEWQNENWYANANKAANRDLLKVYAKNAEKILYKSLPYTDIFITYINNEKGAVHFLYLKRSWVTKIFQGFFYIDSVDSAFELKADASYTVKMFEDQKHKSLFKVYEVRHGDEEFIKHFMKDSTGNVKKRNENAFAFVDDTFIPPKLVAQHNIQDGVEIKYQKRMQFNKKKNSWGWSVEKIYSCVSVPN